MHDTVDAGAAPLRRGHARRPAPARQRCRAGDGLGRARSRRSRVRRPSIRSPRPRRPCRGHSTARGSVVLRRRRRRSAPVPDPGRLRAATAVPDSGWRRRRTRRSRNVNGGVSRRVAGPTTASRRVATPRARRGVPKNAPGHDRRHRAPRSAGRYLCRRVDGAAPRCGGRRRRYGVLGARSPRDGDLAALFAWWRASADASPSIPDAYAGADGRFPRHFGLPGVRTMWLFDKTASTGALRISHVIVGVMWMGLLWFFNFVQVPAYAEMDAAARNNALDKLTWRALWWFRWAAAATVVFGLLIVVGAAPDKYDGDFWTEHAGLTLLLGIIMGIVMAANVWMVIWPNQQIVIAQRAQRAGRRRGEPRRRGRRASRRDGVPPEHDLLAAGARVHGRRVALLRLGVTSISTSRAATWLHLLPHRRRDHRRARAERARQDQRDRATPGST